VTREYGITSRPTQNCMLTSIRSVIAFRLWPGARV
jgi:hypothetical protein